MVDAAEQVETYEKWLEAAETGDFSDVDFEMYDGNSLPDPVMQLSVYEEGDELKVDEEVLHQYRVKSGDIGYRTLQGLAKKNDIKAAGEGRTKERLFEDLKEEYGSDQKVYEAVKNDEDLKFTHTDKFETIVQESLIEEGINGRDRIRDMLSSFKKHSNYDAAVNDGGKKSDDDSKKTSSPLPVQDADDFGRRVNDAISGLKNLRSSKGGENDMTDEEVSNQLRTLAGKVEEFKGATDELDQLANDVLSRADDVNDLEQERDSYRGKVIGLAQGVQSRMDQNMNDYDEVMSVIQRIDNDVDVHLYEPGNDVEQAYDDLTDSLRGN